MNIEAAFEQRLVQALVLDPAASTLQALDERFVRAIARVPEVRASRWSLRRASRPGLAFMLLTVLAGGAVAGSGLMGRVAESVPAFASGWERATPIDQTKTVNGRTVTVVRAYVDANQILVGIQHATAAGSWLSWVGSRCGWTASARHWPWAGSGTATGSRPPICSPS